MRRVAITGIGLISPVGMDCRTFWGSLIEGRTNVGKVPFLEADGLPSQVAAWIDFDPTECIPAKEAKTMDRSMQFAVVAGIQALRDAQLEIFDPRRMGIAIGTTFGGMEFSLREFETFYQKGPRKVSPYLSIAMFHSGSVGQLSLKFGIKGPGIAIPNGVTAGLDAIGYAAQLIRQDQADIMIAGGTEAPINYFCLTAFGQIGLLSKAEGASYRTCRPFSKDRDGFVLAEGSALFILEEIEHARRRKAPIYAEIAGYGSICEPYDVFCPGERTADGRAFQQALEEGRMDPARVGYINANGDGTFLNDASETVILKKIFGKHAYQIPISATKSILGHSLAASGPFGLAATLLSLQHGLLHPTLNYEGGDPLCDLDYIPHRPRVAQVEVALCHAFGYEGRSSALLVQRLPA